MKTVDLNKHIDNLAKKNGIEKYRIDGMSLKDGNYQVTAEGELVREVFIDVKITPIIGYFQLPITFSIKNEDV